MANKDIADIITNILDNMKNKEIAYTDVYKYLIKSHLLILKHYMNSHPHNYTNNDNIDKIKNILEYIQILNYLNNNINNNNSNNNRKNNYIDISSTFNKLLESLKR